MLATTSQMTINKDLSLCAVRHVVIVPGIKSVSFEDDMRGCQCVPGCREHACPLHSTRQGEGSGREVGEERRAVPKAIKSRHQLPCRALQHSKACAVALPATCLWKA